MSTWSDATSLSDRARVARYPLVPSTGTVPLQPCGGPCGSWTSPEVLLDLAAFSEGTLSPAGRRRLFAHLARCHTCRLVLASLDAEPPPAEPVAPDSHPDAGLVAHSQ